jgi:hypothetical protein
VASWRRVAVAAWPDAWAYQATGFGAGCASFVYTGDLSGVLADGEAMAGCPNKFDAIIFMHSIHLMNVARSLEVCNVLIVVNMGSLNALSCICAFTSLHVQHVHFLVRYVCYQSEYLEGTF